MPVKIEKLPGDEVRVSTPGGVKAKHTSFQKAMAQKRLLNAVEHNPDFKPKSAGSRGTGYKATQRSKGSRKIGDALESGGY
jgi:hypothetical protein